MLKLRTATIILLTAALSVSVLGYTGGGESVPTVQCNDGIDNDGSGYIDENDPACTAPYYLDDSEFDVYDLSMSWIAKGLGEPFDPSQGSYEEQDLENPSLFQGEPVVQIEQYGDEGEEDETRKFYNKFDEDEGEEGVFTAFYTNNSHETWGGQEIENVTVDLENVPDNWGVTEHPTGNQVLVPPPSPEADLGYRCGDGQRSDGAEFSCPEDYGLPANQYNDDHGGEVQASTTLTDRFNTEEGEYTVDGHSEEINYSMNLFAPEFYTEDETTTVEDDGETFNAAADSITGEESGYTETYGVDGTENGVDISWENVPDFAVTNDNTALEVIYPVEDGTTTIGSVDNYYLETEYQGEYQSDGSIYTDCEDSDDWDICTTDGDGYTERSDTGYSVTEEEVKEDEVVIGTDSPELHSTEQTNTGWNHETEDSYAYLEVTRDIHDEDEDEQISYYGERSNNQDAYVCDQDAIDDCEDADAALEEDDIDCSCEEQDSETVYSWEEDAISYDVVADEPAEVTYEYTNIDLTSDTIFSINDNDHSDLTDSTDTGPIEAIYGMENDGGTDRETIKGLSSPEDEAVFLDGGGSGFYSWRTEVDNYFNAPAISSSSFSITTRNDEFELVRESFESYTADGHYGHGDGFVAIKHEIENENQEDERMTDEWEVVGSTETFGQEETMTETGTDFVDEELVETLLDEDQNFDGCQDDNPRCILPVQLFLDNLDGWSASNPSPNPSSGVGVAFDLSENSPYHLSDSLGTSELYWNIAEEDMDEDEEEDRDRHRTGSPRNPTPDECDINSDGNWEWHMRGPAVNNTIEDDYESAYTGCIEEYHSCIHHGDEVEEGYMENIMVDEDDVQYEAGEPSPSKAVCLNIQDIEGDSDHPPGGEWYNLDSEVADAYLNDDLGSVIDDYDFLEEEYSDNDGSHVLDEGDSEDTRHISFYWRENINPQHNTYNPRGGEEGLVLENNCGNPRLDDLECSSTEDETSRTNPAGLVYSFLTEDTRDDDYHPQGLDVEEDDVPIESPLFEGYTVKMKQMSDQLEPGMATTHYSMSDEDDDLTVDKWYSTIGGEDYANQWAIAPDQDSSVDDVDYWINTDWEVASGEHWAVDGTGTPYPPWGAHYRQGVDERTNPQSSSVGKTDKAFGNSYATVAGPGLAGEEDDNGITIREGDGVWINPDNLKEAFEAEDEDGRPKYEWPTGANEWYELLDLSMDLTGQDSGLGYHVDGMEDYSHRGSNNEIVWGEMVWETEDGSGTTDPANSNNLHPRLEPYMCGDDRSEYLIEEMGEAPNSERYTGPYACASTPDKCFTSHGNEFVDEGQYMQTNEEGEDFGRLKDDEEYCGLNPDGVGTWYDQDFKQEACRANTLYGSSGVRWFDEGYVQEHPHAVTGGIDDSWNDYMEQHVDEFDDYEQYESRPEADSWDFNTETPVDTGTHRDYTASLGFCGGDDEGEHLVTQEANTDLAETNRDVIGVAASSDYCIFDGEESQYTPEDSSQQERKLHEPGDTIDFQEVDGGSISCYDGTWYDTWPIVYDEVSIEVPFENRRITGFSVINPDDIERTFEVEMSEEFSDSVYTFSEFREETGTSFDVTVPPQSSETFNVIIRGEDNRIENENLVLTAESSDGEVRGEDSLEVTVSEDFESDEVIQGEPESVSGIGFMQIAVLTLSALMLFFLQS